MSGGESPIVHSKLAIPKTLNGSIWISCHSEQRLIRRDGIQLFRIHYWDNVLSPLAGRSDQPYMVRYDPRDLSLVFVKGRGLDGYLAVPYRDLARPPITLMEHRAAIRELAANKRLAMTEDNVFQTINAQRVLIVKAQNKTVTARRRANRTVAGDRTRPQSKKPGLSDEEYTSAAAVEPYPTEVWE